MLLGRHAKRIDLDLALAVGAPVDGAGAGDEVARRRIAGRPQPARDVEDGDSRGRKAAAQQDDVQVAVAIGVDTLDVKHPTRGGPAIARGFGAASGNEAVAPATLAFAIRSTAVWHTRPLLRAGRGGIGPAAARYRKRRNR